MLNFPKLNIYSLGVSKHMLVKQVIHFPNSFVAIMLGNLDQSTYLINSLQDRRVAYMHNTCNMISVFIYCFCISVFAQLQYLNYRSFSKVRTLKMCLMPDCVFNYCTKPYFTLAELGAIKVFLPCSSPW